MLNLIVKKSSTQSFTLIELMVVIAISGMIATMVFVSMRSGGRSGDVNATAEKLAGVIKQTQDKYTFYNLDKVKKGDIIKIKLEDEVLVEYTVINSEIVNPEALQDILNEQTDKYLLKLITCTPLGTDKQRLIVTAEKTISNVFTYQ